MNGIEQFKRIFAEVNGQVLAGKCTFESDITMRPLHKYATEYTITVTVFHDKEEDA